MEIAFTPRYPEFGNQAQDTPRDFNLADDGHRTIWREAFFTVIEPGKIFLRFLGDNMVVTVETNLDIRRDTPLIHLTANSIARALREGGPLRDRYV
jgi:hypothetical protein